MQNIKADEEQEQYLQLYYASKCDHLEWTDKYEIKVSQTLLEIAKEFLKLPFEDCSNTKGFQAVRTNFHHIANDIIFRTIESGKLSEDILSKTGEKYGVSSRRVRIIFEALKQAGWKPRQGRTAKVII